MGFNRSFLAFFVVSFLFTSITFHSYSYAEVDAAFNCEAENGSLLPVMNEQVLRWKRTTQNQFLARANVRGIIVKVLPPRKGHVHFVIAIGKNMNPQSMCESDTLEVVYNDEFGNLNPMTDLRQGQRVQACGDYITSIKPTQRYQPSPACGIIHWVHKNTRGGPHKDGYVFIEDRFYGKTPGQNAPQHTRPMPELRRH